MLLTKKTSHSKKASIIKGYGESDLVPEKSGHERGLRKKSFYIKGGFSGTPCAYVYAAPIGVLDRPARARRWDVRLVTLLGTLEDCLAFGGFGWLAGGRVGPARMVLV